MSAGPDLHAPAEHESCCVHGSPSSQSMPSALLCTQPVSGSQVSVVHGLLSSQSSGVVPPHLPSLQFNTASCVHTPAVQASVLQSLVSVQETHAAPPLPQMSSAVPSWQVTPSQQPLQQAPFSHLPVPPPHGVPGRAAVAEQVPLLQLPIKHSLPVSQFEQVPPALPHAALSVPTAQVVPFIHPVQQLPPRHLPPLQGVLSATLGVLHFPAEQAFVWHSLAALHTLQ